MDLLPQLLTGLASASQLFLVAAGLTVIFGVTRVVNFSHGSLCMLGAYLGWSILTRVPPGPLPFALGVLGTALGVAAVGAVLEVALLRRIYRAPELLQLLATFGVLLMVQDAVPYLWGPNDLSLPRPRWLRSVVVLGEQRFPVFDLVLIGLGPVVLGGLWLLFTRTRWGTLVRAATLDREMVAALGVDQRRLFTGVFALGSGLAGLAGALSLPGGSANPGIDLGVVTDAFVVVVVGGLGSLSGAYLAAVLIGMLQAFGIALVPQATLVLTFLVMAAVLSLRPHGLLGRARAEARAAGAFATIRPAPPALRALGAAALLLALAAPLLAGPYLLGVLADALVMVLFAASLHLMMGPGGMPSFGHAAWFGIGAYAAALLVRDAGMGAGAGMGVALLAAPVLAGAAALLVGAVVVRLSGVYLAMLTLAFAQIVWAAASQLVGWTGGDNGVLGVWPPLGPAGFYWLVLALCLGGTLLLRRVLYAPFGYALRAARDAPARAEASGVPVGRVRLAAFALAGAAAGLSGGVYAFAKGSVFPTYAAIPRSVDALLMVLLGGVQTVAGPVVGALAYEGLYDLLLRVTLLWRLVLGGSIILLVLAFPEGIAGVAARVWARIGARRGVP